MVSVIANNNTMSALWMASGDSLMAIGHLGRDLAPRSHATTASKNLPLDREAARHQAGACRSAATARPVKPAARHAHAMMRPLRAGECEPTTDADNDAR